MYAYARNNPIKFSDKSGKDLYVSVPGTNDTTLTFKYVIEKGNGKFVVSSTNEEVSGNNLSAAALGILNDLYKNGYRREIEQLINNGKHFFNINSGSEVGGTTACDSLNTDYSVSDVTINDQSNSNCESLVAMGLEITAVADLREQPVGYMDVRTTNNEDFTCQVDTGYGVSSTSSLSKYEQLRVNNLILLRNNFNCNPTGTLPPREQFPGRSPGPEDNGIHTSSSQDIGPSGSPPPPPKRINAADRWRLKQN